MNMYSYKDNSFSRGHRQVNTEELFSKGMQYTNAPMQEGWSKLLVNMDMHDSGAALKPRPGLQTTHAYTTASAHTSQIIVAAKEQYINAAESRMQMITLSPTTMVGEENIYELRVVTGAYAENAVTPMDDPLYDAVKWHNYQVSDPVTVRCVIPENAEIHGIPISNTSLARHPGTYGWANRYYFFDEFNKKLVYTEWDATLDKFKLVSKAPKDITAKEAVAHGYNMLKDNPYTFTNSAAAQGSIIQFHGMMPYDADGKLCLTPLVNQSLNFEVFYQVPLNKKYHIVMEWRSGTTNTWTEIKKFDTTFTEVGTIRVPFSPPEENIIIRVSAFGYTESTTTPGEFVRNAFTDATLAVGFNFNKNAYGSTANVSTDNYTLTKARGMTYWQNRLVVWGVPEDPTILFASEVNEPTWFPYPNCCDTFQEPIKYAVPFMDSLLVFTSSKLYMLTMSSDGVGWKQSCIQNNLTIADWDIHLIQVVKNMLFFRSGNYYYMIVPKAASTTGELTLAAVSKPMYYYFDAFKEYTAEVIATVYNYKGALTLKQYFNYLDFEDVHNVYVFQTTHGELLNVDLLYNTVTRHWRMYLMGSEGIQVPYKQDMTQKGTLCSACLTSTNKAAYQLHCYNDIDNRDYFVVHCEQVNPTNLFHNFHVWSNWQHLDTGYRDHTSNLKKRYRELQFVINNRSSKNLRFYTDFFIDGEQRKNQYSYKVVHDTDPQSPTYGYLTVERELTDPHLVPGATSLGADPADTEAWTLDNSMFPGTALWKIRFPVSGKGYTPRMVFTSRNEQPYELLNISWVYRTMYSR